MSMALIKRELLIALRAGGGAGLGLAFFLIVILLVPFGVGPDGVLLAKIAPGILWIAALLACLLSLDRIFQADFEDGTFDILYLSPVPLEGIVAIKAVCHWLTTGLPLLIAAPVLGITLRLPSEASIWLVVSLLIGTPALSFLGAFGAALTVGIRRGGLLLSLLVLPLYIPTLIFGASVVIAAAAGTPVGPALQMLTGISLLTLALVPFTAAQILKMQLR